MNDQGPKPNGQGRRLSDFFGHWSLHLDRISPSPQPLVPNPSHVHRLLQQSDALVPASTVRGGGHPAADPVGAAFPDRSEPRAAAGAGRRVGAAATWCWRWAPAPARSRPSWPSRPRRWSPWRSIRRCSSWPPKSWTGWATCVMLQVDALENKNRLNPAMLEAVREELATVAGPAVEAGRQSALQHRHAAVEQPAGPRLAAADDDRDDPEGAGRPDRWPGPAPRTMAR